MTEAIKNAIALVIFCAPIAAVFTWLVWWNGESIFFVLLLLGLLSGLWVVGYLRERAAARQLGRLDDEEAVWCGLAQLFLTLCAMTALGVIGLYASCARRPQFRQTRWRRQGTRGEKLAGTCNRRGGVCEKPRSVRRLGRLA